MRTKTLMLAGAAAVALTGSGLIAPAAMADPIPPAASYADLLQPVPDAAARLDADDARATRDARVIPAQLEIGIGIGHHHHHHHHHHHSRRWYRANGYYWNGQVWLLAPPPRPRYDNRYDNRGYYNGGEYHDHHHHHHHHHHQNWR
jgi:hypothetical protein